MRLPYHIEIAVNSNLSPYFSADESGFAAILALKNRQDCHLSQESEQVFQFSRGGKTYFAKIDFKIRWSRMIKALIFLRSIKRRRELRANQRLQKMAVRTPIIAAYGFKKFAHIPLQAFMVTEELTDMISLDNYCVNWKQNKPEFALKKMVLIKVATLLRNIHLNGLIHGDCKLCHFFIGPTNKLNYNNINIAVIDLEYAKRNIFKFQCANDVGKLYSTCLNIGLTKRDYLRFMQTYFDQPLRNIMNDNNKFFKLVEKKMHRSILRDDHNQKFHG